MMGRPPKPTRVKELHGNPGRRKLNESEPQPQRKRPRCPEWLDEQARKKWDKLAPELDRLGLLTVVDGDTLAAYCQAWAEFAISTKTLAEEGRVCRFPVVVKEKKVHEVNGQREEVLQDKIIGWKLTAHPAVLQQRSAWRAIKDFAALFGLDPSSRSRLSVPDGSSESDELKAFLGDTGS